MSSAIKSRSTKKLSQIIVAQLIEKIQSGDFTVGEKIPTELELIEQFEVSRSVIREVITELRSLGYVETRHGIGTFVKEHSIEQNFFTFKCQLRNHQ